MVKLVDKVKNFKKAVRAGADSAPTCSGDTKGVTEVSDDGSSFMCTLAMNDGTAANGDLLSSQATVDN